MHALVGDGAPDLNTVGSSTTARTQLTNNTQFKTSKLMLCIIQDCAIGRARYCLSDIPERVLAT